MALSFTGGQLMPAQGTEAYKVASSPNQTGAGSFNASTNELKAGDKSVYSPTVISDANIHETAVPNIQSKTSNLLNTSGTARTTPSTTDTAKNDITNSYEDIYNKVLGEQNALPQSPEVTSALNSYKDLIARSDAASAAQISAMQSNFQSQQKLLEGQNEAETASLRHALSAQGFTAQTIAGVMPIAHTQALANLQDLSSKEAVAEANLRSAALNSDIQLQDKYNNLIQTIRTEKQNTAKDMADKIQAENKAINDAKVKLSESLIAAKNDAMKTAIAHNAPQSVKDAINNSTTSTEAYGALVGYGGTNSEVVDVGSQKLLINKDTGETIKSLGTNANNELTKDADGNNILINKSTGEIVKTYGTTTPKQSTIDADTNYKDFLVGRSVDQVKAFEGLSDIDKSNVSQLINGDALLSDIMASRGITGSQARQNLLMKARQVDPTFSENTNKIRYDFNKQWNSATNKLGMTRNAINTALGHLSELSNLSKSLPQNVIPKMNSVENVLNKNFGDPSVTNFRIALSALASELATVYKGGIPNEGEIKQWESNLAENFAKSQFKGAFDTTASLLSSKVTSTRYQYKSTMGKEYSNSLIDPDKREALIASGIDPNAIVQENVSNQDEKPFVPNDADSFLNNPIPSATPQSSATYSPDVWSNVK
jgi:hypothetical protein